MTVRELLAQYPPDTLVSTDVQPSYRYGQKRTIRAFVQQHDSSPATPKSVLDYDVDEAMSGHNGSGYAVYAGIEGSQPVGGWPRVVILDGDV